MLDQSGRELGRHVGLSFYTIGQRQGLGIGGVRRRGRPGGGDHAPWYVAAKDMKRNALLVVQGHDHPALQAEALDAGDCSWVAGSAPPPGVYGAKTRYRQADSPGTIRVATAGFALDFGPGHLQWAVTPGQSAVLYDGELCLGGGVIERATVPALDIAWAAPRASMRSPASTAATAVGS